MDVKDAISRAKTFIGELFAEEGISDVRLEEVEYDESEKAWNVTLGFRRRTPPSASDVLAAASNLTATLNAISARRRVYRVVRVRESDGSVLSVKHRDLSADAA